MPPPDAPRRSSTPLDAPRPPPPDARRPPPPPDAPRRPRPPPQFRLSRVGGRVRFYQIDSFDVESSTFTEGFERFLRTLRTVSVVGPGEVAEGARDGLARVRLDGGAHVWVAHGALREEAEEEAGEEEEAAGGGAEEEAEEEAAGGGAEGAAEEEAAGGGAEEDATAGESGIPDAATVVEKVRLAVEELGGSAVPQPAIMARLEHNGVSAVTAQNVMGFGRSASMPWSVEGVGKASRYTLDAASAEEEAAAAPQTHELGAMRRLLDKGSENVPKAQLSGCVRVLKTRPWGEAAAWWEWADGDESCSLLEAGRAVVAAAPPAGAAGSTADSDAGGSPGAAKRKAAPSSQATKAPKQTSASGRGKKPAATAPTLALLAGRVAAAGGRVEELRGRPAAPRDRAKLIAERKAASEINFDGLTETVQVLVLAGIQAKVDEELAAADPVAEARTSVAALDAAVAEAVGEAVAAMDTLEDAIQVAEAALGPV